MGKFEFRDNTLRLEIAGIPFDVNITDDYLKKMKQWGQEAQDKAKQNLKIEEHQAFMASAIDKLLGDGASEKIFAGRICNIFDYMDVLNYICSESANYQQNKIMDYQQQILKYSASRAMRTEPQTKRDYPDAKEETKALNLNKVIEQAIKDYAKSID